MRKGWLNQVRRPGRAASLTIGCAMVILAAVACGTAPAPAATPQPSPTSIPSGIPSRPPVAVASTPAPARADQEVRAVVIGFNQAYRAIDQKWAEVHRSYLDWRQQLKGCSEQDRRADLRAWVAGFQPLVELAVQLEPPSGAAEVGRLVTDAVTQEERGLRLLRDTWTSPSAEGFLAYEDARGGAVSLRQEAGARLNELIARAERAVKNEGAQTAAPEAAETPTAPKPSEEEGAPRQRPVPAPTTPLASSTELLKFKSQIDELASKWESFHQRYDAWRQRDGDCDVEAVRKVLRGLVQQFGGVSTAVFGVARPALVRPLAERLMEGAVKQEQALETLRDQWQPYDEGHFRRYSESAAEADKLRRRVASDLDELLHAYGPSPTP